MRNRTRCALLTRRSIGQCREARGSGTSGTAGTTTTSSTTPDRPFDTGGRAPVRTDEGDAAYEVHMKKADGSLRHQNREGQDFDAAALPPLRPASFF
jgi:hypothetical protein